MLPPPRLRAMATQHAEDRKGEIWGLIGQGLASYNLSDLFGSSGGKGEELDAKLPATDDE